MKVLFIGGTGVISSACSALCIQMGIDLYLLNRNQSFRQAPKGSKSIIADIRNVDEVKKVLKDQNFDAVIDWIAYTPEHVINDFDIFENKTSQFIFISSASAYQKPPSAIPIKETERLFNPVWRYSQQKIDCENILMDFFHTRNFPVTIVRPSHTYDKTLIPLYGRYTTLDRMINMKKIIIHGDGTSLWTLTHHKDFAEAFVRLIGVKEAIGEVYHITSDEALSWNQICMAFAEALNVTPEIIHIPSDYINKCDKEWGDGLLGDKSHSMIFDNSKIKSIYPEFKCKIPFKDGAKEIVDWYNDNPDKKIVIPEINVKMDKIISDYEAFFNK